MINRLIKFLTCLDQPCFARYGKLLPLWKSVLYDYVYLLTFGSCKIFKEDK